jgi:TetR/AcrR family transcriptional regulator
MKTRAKTSLRDRAPRKRREQQRAIDTRTAIIDAALAEFGQKGFDAASTRAISQRASLPQPLVLYHFGSKEGLWRAVAEHIASELRRLSQESASETDGLSAGEQLRRRFKKSMRLTISHPAFHQFMLHENISGSPRLTWLIRTYLKADVLEVMALIETAQMAGEMIVGPPGLVFYMIISITQTLSSLRSEIRATTGIVPNDEAVFETYWRMVERAIFRQPETPTKAQ